MSKDTPFNLPLLKGEWPACSGCGGEGREFTVSLVVRFADGTSVEVVPAGDRLCERCLRQASKEILTNNTN